MDQNASVGNAPQNQNAAAGPAMPAVNMMPNAVMPPMGVMPPSAQIPQYGERKGSVVETIILIIVCLIAAAAIVAAGKADRIEEGIEFAYAAIDSGAALAKLQLLVATNH